MSLLDTARKFLLYYIPPAGQASTNTTWNALKERPLDITQNGLIYAQLSMLNQKSPEVASELAAAFTAGFALAYTLGKHPHLEESLKNYIDQCERAKGDNIVNFMHRKTT